jgi:hypothetical protein
MREVREEINERRKRRCVTAEHVLTRSGATQRQQESAPSQVCRELKGLIATSRKRRKKMSSYYEAEYYKARQELKIAYEQIGALKQIVENYEKRVRAILKKLEESA